jgi:DNA-binding transcriptional LysR family regulator
MNIEHIKTFLEIAATGNFNRAAERLNVTQSTASARIKSLEDRLDRVLFLRGRNGATLTAAGRRALPEGYRAYLGLGSQVSLWERLILKWIPWMRQAAPDVALRLEADYSDSLMRQLSDGLLDAGVMYLPRHGPGLVIETLLEERLVLVSSSKRTLSAGWVEDYLYVEWGDDFRAEHSRAFPEMASPAISVGLGALGLQYILENGGSGYFPLRVVRPLLAARRLFRVRQAPEFRRPAYVVYSADPNDGELLQLALTGLRQVAQGERET